MRDGVAELAAGWRKHGHELGFGMGIAYGYATFGRIGFVRAGSTTGDRHWQPCRCCAPQARPANWIDPKVHAAVETLTETERAGEAQSSSLVNGDRGIADSLDFLGCPGAGTYRFAGAQSEQGHSDWKAL